jgi:antitoxin (DNA-binding transcriptional repressor) of toxin-antitoxin stability system
MARSARIDHGHNASGSPSSGKGAITVALPHATVPAHRASRCDAKIDHMETVSIRDLRYRFPKVQRLLDRGEPVQITKRKRVIGTLTPPAPPSAPPNPPDFLGRLEKIWKKPLRVTMAEVVAEGRDRS